MKKTIKLKKNYEFNYILKKGNYFGGEVIECFHKKNNKKENGLGIAISSKIAGAVERNKIKRRIREAYKNLEETIETGNTFVFLWKKKVDIEECSYQKVYQDMEKIFKKIGILKNEQNND